MIKSRAQSGEGGCMDAVPTPGVASGLAVINPVELANKPAPTVELVFRKLRRDEFIELLRLFSTVELLNDDFH